MTIENNCSRPVIIVGAGCRNDYQHLRLFAREYNIPVVSSLPALGLFPTYDTRYFGLIGHAGHPWANKIVQEADLIIALGTRLDIRQTGSETSQFAPNAKIVLANNDPAEINFCRIRVDYAYSSCFEALQSLDNEFGNWSDNHTQIWLQHCNSINLPLPPSDTENIIREIDALYNSDVIFVTGVGSHQLQAARHLSLDYPSRTLLTSSGHGTMGAGLPMAIGAALETKKRVVLIDGDGSFQMSLNELGTWMTHYPELDLKVHIIDNGGGGIVSQFAQLNGYPIQPTAWSNPDFIALAEAYSIRDITVHKTSEQGIWPILEGGHLLSDMTQGTF